MLVALHYGEGTRNLTFDVIAVKGERSLWFVQTDWEYPALARALGWRGKVGREKCEHRSTDGTVKCRECGREAGAFISAARDYLDANIGRCFRVNDDFPG